MPLAITTYEAQVEALEGGAHLSGLTPGESVTRLVGLLLREDWPTQEERERATRLVVRLALRGWLLRSRDRKAGGLGGA
jgi:hypothetical protein